MHHLQLDENANAAHQIVLNYHKLHRFLTSLHVDASVHGNRMTTVCRESGRPAAARVEPGPAVDTSLAGLRCLHMPLTSAHGASKGAASGSSTSATANQKAWIRAILQNAAVMITAWTT
jgi:hypothetical protein